ncbi:hypothetical protein C2E23DRAFT_49603 [Lenzites betulinus]|nr:hypothetical protein C2E23DRAFT_49603 [Lenzites betulinus]
MTPSPPSSRKKPVCHSCGHPMAGHKRPAGSPVCPRVSASPSPAHSHTTSATPTPAPDPAPTLLSRISPEDVRFAPTSSGYWHRRNPHWVEPEHYARIPSHAAHEVPKRGETVVSWHSTELDELSVHAPSHGRPLSQEYAAQEVPSDSEEDEGAEITADSTRQTRSASFTLLGRQVSKIFGDMLPLASLYGAPTEDVRSLEHAAREHGLATAVVRSPRTTVKAEPSTPDKASDSGSSRAGLSREFSWWLFVGRDRSAVNALADSQTAAAGARRQREPYDYDKGLVKELDERVGAYPVNPRAIRQNFCDVIIAGVVSAFAVVWILSYM